MLLRSCCEVAILVMGCDDALGFSAIKIFVADR